MKSKLYTINLYQLAIGDTIGDLLISFENNVQYFEYDMCCIDRTQ